MKIKDIAVRQIFDSRGEPTIEIELISGERRSFRAQVPSGKSRGTNEAYVVPFRTAREIVARKVRKELVGRNLTGSRMVDRKLLALDGTANKRNLGGNVTLGISIAAARMFADETHRAVWEYIREEFFPERGVRPALPFIFSNLINGGAHARNNLSIQEYMVVVRPSHSLEQGIRALVKFYRDLGEYLKKRYRAKNLPIGDEGGYSLDFKNNFEPIAIMGDLIRKYRLQGSFGIGLDAAATNFFRNGNYFIDKKSISRKALVSLFSGYFKRSPLLVSIEDPFAENDEEGFQMLRGRLPKDLIVGDDLTTTDASLIQRFAGENTISGVIIKPNQIGTVTETCEAVRTAHNNGIKTIISHRSGETEDNFIVHLARASGAYGLKIGAPVRERIFKFNEILRLYEI